jgi:spermidine/putrescine transport system permease protein
MRRLSPGGALYLGLVYVFLFAPTVLVVLFSFNSGRFWSFPLRAFSWRWYAALLDRPDALAALGNSLSVAGAVVPLALACGTCLAFAFHRWATPIRAPAELLILMPLLIPALIWAISLLLFLTWLHVPLGAPTVIGAQTLYLTTYTFLLAGARFRSLDPAWEDAARSLGAGTRLILRRVVLPHVLPALLAGALLTFALSFSDLVIAFFLGGNGFNTLPVFIYGIIESEPSPMVNAVSTIVFGAGLLCLLVAVAVVGKDAVLLHRDRGDD